MNSTREQVIQTQDELACYKMRTADLEFKVAEREADANEYHQVATNFMQDNEKLRQQLAEAQAQVEKLREALKASDSWYRSYANMHHKDIDKQISDALSIQSPSDALREHDERLVEKLVNELNDKVDGSVSDAMEYLEKVADKIRKGKF